ncbi:PilZ domain-containing protein [Gilvimarinus polysaccharolyticus]|uniref:PilZ domain-containing protein n=1 Tax=Gilvimarinus polysaccharolyticus TaxID=863921 RepID=UPI0006737880|nr:PilZ domain-containing protein [Gilvimarinus polysaccharolyticus]
MTDSDRRHFQRIPFHTDVSLSQAGFHWHAQLLDISLKGLLIQGPLPPEVDTSAMIRAEISLSELQDICMQVEVAHHDNNCIGLNSISIDVVSIRHLRRLVELNIGAEAAERELHELL